MATFTFISWEKWMRTLTWHFTLKCWKIWKKQHHIVLHKCRHRHVFPMSLCWQETIIQDAIIEDFLIRTAEKKKVKTATEQLLTPDTELPLSLACSNGAYAEVFEWYSNSGKCHSHCWYTLSVLCHSQQVAHTNSILTTIGSLTGLPGAITL